MTKQRKDQIIERLVFLRQMVKQLDTDLTFGYIYLEEYKKSIQKVSAEIDEIEKEILNKKK